MLSDSTKGILLEDKLMPSVEKTDALAQVSVPQDSVLGLTEPVVDKLVGYGGFVASVLVLCLFFRVLTDFVKGVK
jgi:hypothetical protein